MQRIVAGGTNTFHPSPTSNRATSYQCPSCSLARHLRLCHSSLSRNVNPINVNLTIAERLRLFNYIPGSLGCAIDGKEVSLELGVPKVRLVSFAVYVIMINLALKCVYTYHLITL